MELWEQLSNMAQGIFIVAGSGGVIGLLLKINIGIVRLQEQAVATSVDMGELKRAVFGNGQKGLKDRVEGVETHLNSVCERVEDIDKYGTRNTRK